METAGIKGPSHLKKGNSVFNMQREQANSMINIQQHVRNNATDV